MPSVEENRCVADEAVGENSTVAVGGAVRLIGSIVEVGRMVGGAVVGAGVNVGSIVGISAGAQAVRSNKASMMDFFIVSNYMSLQAQGQPACR